MIPRRETNESILPLYSLSSDGKLGDQPVECVRKTEAASCVKQVLTSYFKTETRAKEKLH